MAVTKKFGELEEVLTMPRASNGEGCRAVNLQINISRAPAVNSIVLIDVLVEMFTDVVTPSWTFAVLSGTVGVQLQSVPVVHSLPGPVQLPLGAIAAVGPSVASAPKHALATRTSPRCVGE